MNKRSPIEIVLSIRLLLAFKTAIETLNFLEIAYKVSPFLTL